VETTRLPDVTPFRHFEPSIAADPDRPDRVLLASTRRQEQPFRTEVDARFSGDGGRTWNEPEPVLRHGYDRLAHGGGDPVALAGLDGRFHVATLLEVLPAEPGGRRRSGIGLGTWERVGADSAAGGAARLRWLAEVAMYRGTERPEAGEPAATAGRQGHMVDVLRAPARTGGTGADKQWLAVDRSRGPRRGTVFAVWDEVTDRGIGRAMFGFSNDSGRTFRAWPLRVVPAQRGSRFFQIVVRPDGVIDLFWVNYARAAVTRIFSRDGGISWSEPEAVSALAPVTLPNGAFYFDQLSAVAGPDGSLAVCGVAVPAWKATLPGAESPPGRAYCATSRDGRRWRSPMLIDRPADSIGMNDSTRTVLPAVAATPGALWVTAYRLTADSTRVVLYRSRDAGASWAEVATLAARGFGRGGVRSLGAAGVFDPGDYQGLAAAGSRLYAAFVLPAGDDPAGPVGLYVSRIELR
jgi:hypothetical protein